MPPVTKAGNTEFRKDVAFTSKDADEQLAAGIVMVPDKADLQNDFAREDTIREFATQFETFVEAGEAGGGIMHAVFPDDWMALERNEVLDASEEIGGETVEAGAWVQEWRIQNDDLWALIDDGILAGYSIGAIQVDWNGPFEQDEVDDVAVPDDLSEEALIWELTDGLIREVSAVDIPAVPDAQILATKADAQKRLGDYLGDPQGFLAEAQERGHSEAEAERLWEVLNDAVGTEGAGEPGEKGFFHRLGKAAADALFPSDEGGRVAETPDTDPRKTAGDADSSASNDKNAPGSDTPDDDSSTTDMTEPTDDDGGENEKSLAEQNAEQIDELTQAVDDLTAALTGDEEEKTREIELDGETVEVSEEELKAALGVETETDGGDVESLKSDIQALADRVDSIAEQSGRTAGSNQIRSAATDDDDGEKGSGLDDIGAALS